jgi:hypothetical protein
MDKVTPRRGHEEEAFNREGHKGDAKIAKNVKRISLRSLRLTLRTWRLKAFSPRRIQKKSKPQHPVPTLPCGGKTNLLI